MTSRVSRSWAACAAIAVVALAAWLRTAQLAALVTAAAAVVASVAVAWRRRPGITATLATIALAMLTALEGASRMREASVTRAPTSAASAEAARAGAALASRITREADALRDLAERSLDAPAEPVAAFAALDRLRNGVGARSVMLGRGGTLVAWSGRQVGPIDSLPGPAGVVASEFYLVLYAVAGRGADRAVATSVLHAIAPAVNLVDAVDEPLAASFDIATFAYRQPDVPTDSFVVVHASGAPILAVRALPLSDAEFRHRTVERGLTSGIVALAACLLLYVAALWPSGAIQVRVAALAVALVTVAVAPLASLSSRTAVFNPAYFFAGEGGPYTANIGALAIAALLVLLGVLAADRARQFPRTGWRALVVVFALAALAPFLLTTVARGIRFPVTGASVALWASWETGIFLTATVVLYAGIAIGDGARGWLREWLGRVPAWVGPALATLAAGTAPLVVEPQGGLPQWYTVVWVVVIAATALGRRGRGTVWVAATVAAMGSSATVWNETVKARVALAEADVAALTHADSSASALVRRFPAQLDSATAPRSRVDLLARYAASDLASSDIPVEITTWTPRGAIIADLRVGLGLGTARGVEYFAREASVAMKPTLTFAPGEPGVFTVLAVPHGDHSVTTVVAAPRTRLVTPDQFPAIAGLRRSRDAGGAAPYALQLAPAPPTAFISTSGQWTRRDTELHGDWFIPAAGGRVSHVHARVPLSGSTALWTRGGLLVFANLGVIGLLLLLMVVAEGGALRRGRALLAAWVRSYRARLTLTLFAALALPVLAFAVWTYKRLQDGDADARGVLVRETLRAVAATQGVGLDTLGARFDTPLFLYANGVLVATSDPVLDALLPVGRLLPSEAATELLSSDEGFATAELPVAGEAMRFGFRVLPDTSAASSLVLATPVRTAELALDPRRRDLAFFVLFATLAGALAALWLSGLAGRSFAKPIGELRAGALALASGEREPRLAGDPPAEFQPVFAAFRQMAHDLDAHRDRDARAQRVLAWGEMARQVAHEIKNPLTPMRLGVQHLLRAKDDPRVDFRKTLDENAARLLEEIDRLDEIARAFSRYGTAPDDQPPADRVDVAEAVRDVVRLEALGGGGVAWRATGIDAPVLALARPTEMREVLLNLLENARNAGAAHVDVRVTADATGVRVEVRDDGHGIDADVLPKIFEPHFSTSTSGSGLGLAISRRLIEGWGGQISVASTPGAGATFTISLAPAAAS